MSKNLLIINIIMYIGSLLIGFHTSVSNFALFYFDSPHFEPYQIVTHMFMHGGLGHIFFNMFALVMFGTVLEKVWGPKRFLKFYLITGLGAVLLHQGMQAYDVFQATGSITVDNPGRQVMSFNSMDTVSMTYNVPTLGASGAIFGLLVGFGVLFPNTELMLIFLPIPIKAKYFIPFLILIELYLGIQKFSWDNMAHFAHLGGALFGYIMIKYWQSDRNKFY
ncbi:MAG: rhomboid family intramembrane serine protease [Flavobacteriales bacterium]